MQNVQEKAFALILRNFTKPLFVAVEPSTSMTSIPWKQVDLWASKIIAKWSFVHKNGGCSCWNGALLGDPEVRRNNEEHPRDVDDLLAAARSVKTKRKTPTKRAWKGSVHTFRDRNFWRTGPETRRIKCGNFFILQNFSELRTHHSHVRVFIISY